MRGGLAAQLKPLQTPLYGVGITQYVQTYT